MPPAPVAVTFVRFEESSGARRSQPHEHRADVLGDRFEHGDLQDRPESGGVDRHRRVVADLRQVVGGAGGRIEVDRCGCHVGSVADPRARVGADLASRREHADADRADGHPADARRGDRMCAGDCSQCSRDVDDGVVADVHLGVVTDVGFHLRHPHVEQRTDAEVVDVRVGGGRCRRRERDVVRSCRQRVGCIDDRGAAVDERPRHRANGNGRTHRVVVLRIGR